MNREQAIEIARRFAKAKPQSYYTAPFQPHEWVIDAIVAAYLKGYYVVLPNGMTLAEHALPQIEQAYTDGKMPPLLSFGG